MQNDSVRCIFISLACSAALLAQSGSLYHAADDLLAPGYASGYSVPLQTSETPPTLLAPGSLATILRPLLSSPPSALEILIRPVGLNSTIPAQVVAITSERLTFVVPRELLPGHVQIIYRAAGDISRWVNAIIVPSRLLLFRSWASGPVAAQRIGSDGTPGPVGLATPVSPGESLILWGSGLGAAARSEISVTIGGVSQQILFAGPSPASPGLDQFNIRVGAGTPSGCYVTLILTAGGTSINSTISVGAGGSPCPHPLSLTSDNLRSLDQRESVTAGRIDVTSDLTVAAADHASRQEAISVSILPRSPSEFQSAAAPELPASGCSYSAPGPGDLGIFGYLVSPFPVFGPVITATNGTNSLRISTTGSNSDGESAFLYASALKPSQDAALTSVPPPVLSGGKWTFSSPSNAAVTFSLELPPSVQLLGAVPLVFRRGTDGVVSWRAADYRTTDLATITISAAGSPYLTRPTITCSTSADLGTVSIPLALLTKMPSGMATLTIKVSPQFPARVSVPITRDSGRTFFPMAMIPNVSTSETRPVDIQ